MPQLVTYKLIVLILVIIVVIVVALAIFKPEILNWIKNLPEYRYDVDEEIDVDWDEEEIKPYTDFASIDEFEASLKPEEQLKRKNNCMLYDIKWTLDKNGENESKEIKAGGMIFMYVWGSTGCKNKQVVFEIYFKEEKIQQYNAPFSAGYIAYRRIKFSETTVDVDYYFKTVVDAETKLIPKGVGMAQEAKSLILKVSGKDEK